MADNTTLSTGTGGDVIRDVDKAGIKTQVVILDIGGTGAENLLNGTLPVSAVSLPLPSGAATGAKQDTGNTSVASIDSKVPALGQALAAASVPVILPAATVTTLTPPAAIVGFALEAGHLAAIDTATAKIPAQGQALAAASMPVVLPATQITTLTPPAAITGFALEAGHLAAIDTATARIPAQGQAAMAASTPVVIASNQSAVPVSGTFWQATQPVSGTFWQATQPVSGTFWQATQPVSGTVTVNQGAAQTQGTAGWPTNPYGMSDSLFASGNVLGAVAGAAICTLTTPAAGTYRVDISTMCSGDGVTAPVFQNMEFRRGAAVLVAVLDGVANRLATAPTGNADNLQNLRITLDGTTSLSINATASYGAADNAIARIIATRIF